MTAKESLEKSKIFIIVWAICVGIFLVKIDYVDLTSIWWWVLTTFLNVVGIAIYWKLEVDGK